MDEAADEPQNEVLLLSDSAKDSRRGVVSVDEDAGVMTPSCVVAYRMTVY